MNPEAPFLGAHVCQLCVGGEELRGAHVCQLCVGGEELRAAHMCQLCVGGEELRGRDGGRESYESNTWCWPSAHYSSLTDTWVSHSTVAVAAVARTDKTPNTTSLGVALD